MKWQRFVNRFMPSVSFSAYTLALRVIPPEYVRGLVPLWIACVVCSQRLRGLQDVFAMLAGRGISDLVPMPMEPSGYLVLPAVIVYLAVISSVTWAVYHGLGAHGAETPVGGGLTTAIEQYLSLFSVTRAVLAFTIAGQQYPLYVLSIAHTVLCCVSDKNSDKKKENAQSSKERQEEGGEGKWMSFFQRNLEGVAMRGAGAWLLNEVLRPQCSGETLLVLQVVSVYLSGWTPRLSSIHGVLSTGTARHLLILLRDMAKLSEAACLWLLASSVVLLELVAPDQTLAFSELCAFVASLLLTGVLERSWLVAGTMEAGTLYLVTFCLLEVLQRSIPTPDPTLASAAVLSKLPVQIELGLLLPAISSSS
jgi:hypothetical protein